MGRVAVRHVRWVGGRWRQWWRRWLRRLKWWVERRRRWRQGWLGRWWWCGRRRWAGRASETGAAVTGKAVRGMATAVVSREAGEKVVAAERVADAMGLETPEAVAVVEMAVLADS